MIPSERRILRGGGYVNLFDPKCAYYRPDFLQVEEIAERKICLGAPLPGVRIFYVTGAMLNPR